MLTFLRLCFFRGWKRIHSRLFASSEAEKSKSFKAPLRQNPFCLTGHFSRGDLRQDQRQEFAKDDKPLRWIPEMDYQSPWWSISGESNGRSIVFLEQTIPWSFAFGLEQFFFLSWNFDWSKVFAKLSFRTDASWSMKKNGFQRYFGSKIGSSTQTSSNSLWRREFEKGCNWTVTLT